MSFATFCVCLTEVPSLRQRYPVSADLSATQSARPLPRGRPVDPVIPKPDHALGLPVLRALSLCTCCRQYPGAATGRRLRSSRPAVSAFPEVASGRPAHRPFRDLLSVHSRCPHTRAVTYIVTSYTEGFSHFVTSMTAPVASGWSVRRVGLAPTGKRRLLTAHATSGSHRCNYRGRNSPVPLSNRGHSLTKAPEHIGKPALRRDWVNRSYTFALNNPTDRLKRRTLIPIIDTQFRGA